MRPRHLLAGGALAAAVGLGTAGPAHPSAPTDPSGPSGSSGPSRGQPVVIEPNPAPAGSLISVFDGGNCGGSRGLVTFRDGDAPAKVPSVRLTPLRDRVGGASTVPLHTEPGSYTVSLMCHDDSGTVRGPFTGTLRVVAGHRPDHPRGATQAGLGGSAAVDAREAGMGAALVAAAVSGAVLLHRGRARRGRG
ncbi:hypothetical protein [Streptomyces sp. 8N706]|uniref:hypothetical protein n=1 Tax=Streptomyces sp. 8N706 TaxID=3457416 RepID=UPI003FD32C4C